jgi:hypothetical protein
MDNLRHDTMVRFYYEEEVMIATIYPLLPALRWCSCSWMCDAMHLQRRSLRHVDLPYARVQASAMHITITYIKRISTATAAGFVHKSDVRWRSE